ncbi:MAG: hypothetical protein H6719_31055 [Sandaracinaceae bacterium]|nr:hypothetical protein [Sandaracinaceae bacterium]
MTPTDSTEWLDRVLRAEPGTPGAGTLAAWLEDLDDARWAELVPILEQLARATPSRDVIEPDDLLGELVVAAYERWIPRYRAELAAGEAKASLHAYLKLRLEGHVAELRRKARRRRELLATRAATSDPVLMQPAPSPFEEAAAEEVLRKTSSDATLRAVMALRYAGFSQGEIAGLLKMSRPTVTRRVAVLAGLVTALLLVGLAVAWWTRPEPARVATITPDGEGRVAPRAAGGEDPEPPQPTERDADEAPPAPPTHPRTSDPDAPPPPSPPPPARAGWSEDDTRTVILRRRSELQRCLEGLAGDATFEIVLRVNDDGAVTDARVLDQPPRVRMIVCVTRVLRSLGFPSQARGRELRVGLTLPDTDRPRGPATIDEQAADCTVHGDLACVIRLLAVPGRADSPTRLAMLIEAYRARGQTEAATIRMRELVERFPEDPRAEMYRGILARSR